MVARFSWMIARIGSSAAAEATLGYREDEIIGKRFRDVFVPANGAHAAIAAIETAIAQRRPVSVDEVAKPRLNASAIPRSIPALPAV